MTRIVLKLSLFALMATLRICSHRRLLSFVKKRADDKWGRESIYRDGTTCWAANVPMERVLNGGIIDLSVNVYSCAYLFHIDESTTVFRDSLEGTKTIDLIATTEGTTYKPGEVCDVLYAGSFVNIAQALECNSFKRSATLLMVMAFTFSLF